MTGVLIKRGNLGTDMRTGRMPYEDAAENLQAKEHRRLPANCQNLGERNGTDSPSPLSEGTNFPDTLTSSF